jgi:hypothetical protein
MLIWTLPEEGMPNPPTDTPKLAPTALAAKLRVVQTTTTLGTHREPRMSTRGPATEVDVANEWSVVYGRIVRSPSLDEDCGPNGCGGFDVPLIIVARPDQVQKIRDDGTRLLPDKKP